MSDDWKVEVRGGAGSLRQDIRIGGHELTADEPEDAGGDGAGPNPYEYLLAGLGACKAMTLRMYADRKDWPLEDVIVRLRHDRIHADDCADCDTEHGQVTEIVVDLEIRGDDLTDEQRERLLQIAGRCPVHKTLSGEIKIRDAAA